MMWPADISVSHRQRVGLYQSAEYRIRICADKSRNPDNTLKCYSDF